MNYDTKDLRLLHMERTKPNPYSVAIHRDPPTRFIIENTMTLDEKITFINDQTDGIATYLIDLFTKWKNEKDNLPQTADGEPKTVSKKAWFRKHDTSKMIHDDYARTYHLLGTTYTELSLVCPTAKYGAQLAYTGEHIAHQWFHDLLKKLYREEKAYFESIDPVSIKLKTVKELGSRYTVVFNSHELNDIVWNGERNVPEEHLDAYIQAYETLEASIKSIESSLHDNLTVAKIE